MSLNTGHWIELSDPANASARQAQLVIEINRWVGISLAIAIAILLVMTALEVWRLVARQRTGTQVRQPQV